MSLIRCLPASILFAATVIACVGEATAQYASLVARVPRGANTIVILDVQRLLDSPLAKQQNWRDKQERAAEAGITMVAPTAQQFLMASHLDYEFMQPVWEVAMANLSYEPSLPRLAARWAGEIDRISNVTEYNGQKLLDGTAGTGGTLTFQVGTRNTANDRITISMADTDATALGVNASAVDSLTNAQTAIDDIDALEEFA